ncbi:MAG: transketolase [Deltaproteobacteria bacterium]|nr:transketolase [Deltaproteobacteria bacterium]
MQRVAEISLTESNVDSVESLAYRARRHVVAMAGRGGCFIGSAFSCIDIIACLYCDVMRIDPQRLNAPERDYFLLSKGHAVPALYAVLVERGFFGRRRLDHHLQPSDDIYLHPNRNIPGIEFHSGSLGHALAVGIGIALDIKLRKKSNRVFVLLGDGELNEGSVWESIMVARAQQLDNLIAIVDRNRRQANLPTESLVPLEPLSDKFAAFGWSVRECDGHDFKSLRTAFHPAPARSNAPNAIIAHTARGRGIASIQDRANGWFMKLDEGQRLEFLAELDQSWETAR